MIIFYTVTAPEWWPFQVVSITHRRLPPRRIDYYYLLVDNGMYNFVLKNERPSLDVWISSLRRFVYEVYRTRRPVEMIVILPDWFKDPEFTLNVAKTYSKLFCKDYKCMVVAHYNFNIEITRMVEEILSIDGIEIIGVPCKLYCSRKGKNRRIANYACMKMLIEIVHSYVRDKEKIHALGLGFNKDLLGSVKDRIRSFDNSTWSRPFSLVPKHYSAKTKSEREEYFIAVLKSYSEYLFIPSSIPSDVFAYILQGA
ncbi:MAG: hypothetical protein J7K21_00955 [Desulfurococcales archaeon]|nr:hypothetical protein [Desulfurococcales archaeon]